MWVGAHISLSAIGPKWVRNAIHGFKDPKKWRALRGIKSVLFFLTTWCGPLSWWSWSTCEWMEEKFPRQSYHFFFFSFFLPHPFANSTTEPSPLLVQQAHISEGCLGKTLPHEGVTVNPKKNYGGHVQKWCFGSNWDNSLSWLKSRFDWNSLGAKTTHWVGQTWTLGQMEKRDCTNQNILAIAPYI